MFDDLFARKTLNTEKALSFGFKAGKSGYEYEAEMTDGMFRLQVTISFDGGVDTRLFDTATGEEYVLYKTNACGSFVQEIRGKIENVLIQVAENCYDIEVFKSAQAKQLIMYVHDRYGDELEYLWEKFPDNAVCRRKDNRKWYAAILTVPGRKLGLPTDDILEIIDLRLQKELMAQTLDNSRYFPGWHMNKKHWYTIVLDGRVPTEEICRRIDESYLLAKK